MIEFSKKVAEIVSYFRQNEKSIENFKIGVEFEHFIVDKNTLKSINYYEKNGVKTILEDLLDKGWDGKYEGEHLLGLSKDGTNITLEPGAQFEISIKPYWNIKDIEQEYMDFLEDVIPILEKNNQLLVAIGYHPESSINDIPFIPKGRYKYMSEHFETRGKYAHNMMKGTAATQVTFDYGSEEDYIKKFRITNVLSPVIAMMFDNSPFFEGNIYRDNSIRTKIWNNCDSDRCGIVDSVLSDNYGYDDYAKYILNAPPIIILKGEEVEYTKSTPYRDIFNPEEYTIDELEHVMTMVFPDVRTKKFIEIRMADSIPYPMNLAKVALWKGLLYNSDNLDTLYSYLSDITYDDIIKAKLDIIENGFDAYLGNKNIYDIGQKLIDLAKIGLDKEEVKYLEPLTKIFLNRKTPAQITKEKLHLGKSKAIEWCVLNNII